MRSSERSSMAVAEPDETWMSLNTILPQRSTPETSSGVVNDRYCTVPAASL